MKGEFLLGVSRRVMLTRKERKHRIVVHETLSGQCCQHEIDGYVEDQ